MFLFVLGLGCFNATAADVTLEPSTQIVTNGETFTVDVFVTPDTAIAGLQFDLEFDNSKIRVESVSEGRLLNQNGASTFFNDGNVENSVGMLSGVYGLILGSSSISEPASFASITMSVNEQALGTSTIGLKNVIISDPSGKSINAFIRNTTIEIGKPNSAPIMVPVGPKTVTERDKLIFKISATDEDGDVLEYLAKDLPTGAKLDSTSGEFRWMPKNGQMGTYVVMFTVTDGQLTDSETVTITVEPYSFWKNLQNQLFS